MSYSDKNLLLGTITKIRINRKPESELDIVRTSLTQHALTVAGRRKHNSLAQMARARMWLDDAYIKESNRKKAEDRAKQNWKQFLKRMFLSAVLQYKYGIAWKCKLNADNLKMKCIW